MTRRQNICFWWNVSIGLATISILYSFTFHFNRLLLLSNLFFTIITTWTGSDWLRVYHGSGSRDAKAWTMLTMTRGVPQGLTARRLGAMSGSPRVSQTIPECWCYQNRCIQVRFSIKWGSWRQKNPYASIGERERERQGPTEEAGRRNRRSNSGCNSSDSKCFWSNGSNSRMRQPFGSKPKECNQKTSKPLPKGSDVWLDSGKSQMQTGQLTVRDARPFSTEVPRPDKQQEVRRSEQRNWELFYLTDFDCLAIIWHLCLAVQDRIPRRGWKHGSDLWTLLARPRPVSQASSYRLSRYLRFASYRSARLLARKQQ